MVGDEGGKQGAARDLRRQTLVDAAQALFARKGYHATTVDDITRAAGVAKGTFYLYFDEKRVVYRQVIRAFLDRIMAIGAGVGRQADNPAEFIGQTTRAAEQLLALIVHHPELARLAYRESVGLDPELEQMVRQFYRDLAEVEARNIERAIELGLVRPVHPLTAAYAHIGMVERVLLAAAQSPADFPDHQAVVRELMALAFEGVNN